MKNGLVLLLPLLSLSVPRYSRAQDVTGGLLGRAISDDGRVISAVTVTVSGSNLQGQRHTVADSRGEFRFVALPAGVYSVRLARIGFREATVENVRVDIGKTTGLPPIAMQEQTVELEPLVVSAATLSIDPTSTAVAGHLDATELEVLPIDRDYQKAFVILPHANESFYGDAANIGGATGLENAYYIDGVNVTTPHRAATGTRLPYNFIESIEVKEGGYEAQYGRALGGVVNALTYSGGNDFEAHVFGFFTNSSLATESRPGGLAALTTNAFATYDFGFRLSGPIVRDRLWFTTAYNPTFQRAEKQIPGHGSYDDRRTEHRFAGKLTWRATQTTDVQLSLFGDPTTHHTVGGVALTVLATDEIGNPDPLLGFLKEGGVNLALRGRQSLGDWGILEGSIGRSTVLEVERGDTDRGRSEPTFYDFVDGSIEDGYWTNLEWQMSRTAATVSGTAFLDRHTVSVGAEYEDNSQDGGFTMDLISRKSFGFETILEEPRGTLRNRVPTLYAQDSWRVTELLTVNAGVRWSQQYLLGDADSVAQVLEDEWQPRIGFALQLGSMRSQKLFGSFGRFYQQTPLYVSTMLYLPYLAIYSYYSTDPREGGAPDETFDWSTNESNFPKREGIQVDHLDEFTVGYEHVLSNDLKLSVRGIRRVLRSSFGFGWDFDDPNLWVVGTPGEGELDFLPSPSRTYAALALTAERAGNHRLRFLASYVLSRSHGNYTGLFSTDQGLAIPGNNYSLQLAEQAENSTGLLPNDRTHVFKVSGSYQFSFGLTTGAFITVQSGTPLNEFGASSVAGHPVFLVTRGSAGRTATLYDVNFRFTYRIRRLGAADGRITLDLLHVGSPRRAVWMDQWRFFEVDEDGNQTNENPNFGEPLAYQPPMTVRLGFDWSF